MVQYMHFNVRTSAEETFHIKDNTLSGVDSFEFVCQEAKKDLLPIILILGPCASGKGTLSKRLAAEYNLFHLSVGDWLREQAKPPIAGVSEKINRYVHDTKAIPEELLKAEYGSLDNAPPSLVLYQCGKLNISTPESLKINSMPALRAECARVSSEGKFKGILIDNLQQNLRHCDAAAKAFGTGFPTMLIAVDCADKTAKARYLSRARGADDATRFERRIARFRVNYDEVVRFFEASGPVVRVNTDADANEAYQGLLRGLSRCKVWHREFETSTDMMSSMW